MKKSILTLITLIALLTFSCETEIPETDSTAPTFSLHIKSARFEHTFTQDDDFNNITLKLKNDAGYQFTLTGVDNGGVRMMRWQVPSNDHIEFDNEILSPWTIRNISPFNRMIEFLGDRNNPYTAEFLNGKFRAKGNQAFAVFNIFISDFGGESANYNNASAALDIAIGNWEAEIIEN
ncbi:hypothetical protein [Winogradskyella thalassocola]|uniref:Uncharacterized protein n=1 Tax=Winogradskyella thalassocola TaxID=262004 RepID=A0A1G8BK21_9FLAO|nr:hypothetical protein [Winogradskyella thalassocola]SDH33577.1 hypothetical protein SAMN04489796_102351 [Winogradskyella thalassocola]